VCPGTDGAVVPIRLPAPSREQQIERIKKLALDVLTSDESHP
jgi:hypothetical protein